MGRLDDFYLLPFADPFDGHCTNQFVRPESSSFRVCHTDFFLSIVTHHGMGQDIWNVEFDDITTMLKVRTTRRALDLVVHLEHHQLTCKLN